MLLENLLEWSKIQTGSLIAKPSMFVLKDTIHNTCDLTTDIVIKKGILLEIEVPDQLSVFSDERMVEGILRNLTSNAIKFTTQGGKVRIAAKMVSDGLVQISVIDTGIGMSQKIIDSLFVLETKNGRKGTDGEPSSGLGLILVKEFVEKIGGEIWVESEESVGSKFHFTIPSYKN